MKISLQDLTGTEELSEHPQIEQTPSKSIKPEKIEFYKPINETELNLLKKEKFKQILNDKKSLKEKIILKRFEAKMQKINKIKSKNYRKKKRKFEIKNKMENEISESEEIIYEENENTTNNDNSATTSLINNSNKSDSDFVKKLLQKKTIQPQVLPIFEYTTNKPDLETITALFTENEFENTFNETKKTIVENEIPKTEEIFTNGWGNWAGTGIETIKNKYNTITINKEGLNLENRKDLKQNHVIINHNVKDIDDKYKAIVPYGLTKEGYKKRLNIPVSKELNSAQMFVKFVHDKNAGPEDFYEYRSKYTKE